jgi:hypothetical protein
MLSTTSCGRNDRSIIAANASYPTDPGDAVEGEDQPAECAVRSEVQHRWVELVELAGELAQLDARAFAYVDVGGGEPIPRRRG